MPQLRANRSPKHHRRYQGQTRLIKLWTIIGEIIDVETNKAVMGVTTPGKGKIDKITVELKETYPVGVVLGYIGSKRTRRRALHQTRLGAVSAAEGVAEEIPRAPIRKSLQRARRKSARAMAMANDGGGFACSCNYERRNFHVTARARAWPNCS